MMRVVERIPFSSWPRTVSGFALTGVNAAAHKGGLAEPSSRQPLRRMSQRSHRFLYLATALIVSAILLVPSALFAQDLSGIAGTVADPSGAVIPGADVTATNIATGVSTHTVTSAVGEYFITGLIPGKYTIRVQKSGFSTASVQEITVETGGKKSSVNVLLKPGAVTQTITVNASQISLETSPALGTTVSHTMIEELPNEFGTAVSSPPHGRTLDAFMLLTPGVSKSNQSGFRLNGGQDYQNGSSLNGISVPYSNNPGNMDQFDVPFEMVDQARVVTSNTSPQAGLGAGVAAYGFTSGTNVLHGSAFEIMRNSMFDAPGAYPLGWTGVGPKATPTDHENNFGYALGGPVIIPHLYNGKNKTFFFFTMEWYRYTAPYTALGTAPTDAMKQGDFSQDFTPCSTPGQGTPPCNANGQQIIPIFVPQAWATNPASIPPGCSLSELGLVPGQQFHGISPTTGKDTLNVIPQSCFSQITKTTFLPLFPSPNNVGPANPNPNTNNIFPVNSNVPARERKWGFSIDHSITENQKLHGSFWHSPYQIIWDSGAYPESSALANIQSQKTTGNGILLNYSNSISNRLVATVGAIGVEGYDDWQYLRGVGNGLYPSVIQSATASPDFYFNNDINGIGSFGVGAPPIQPRHNKGITLTNSWIYTMGRQTLTFGGEWRMTKQYQEVYTYPEGAFNFNANTTSNNLYNPNSQGYDINNTGSAFASFLLGDVDSASRNNSGFLTVQNSSYSPYVQDNIKATPKLTLNLGLRWDILVPFTVNPIGSPGRVTFFQPNVSDPGAVSTSTGQPLSGGMSELGTCAGCAGFNRADIHWKNFGPRVGFAYQLKKKTVIRGGYSISYLPGGAYNYGDSGITNQFAGLLSGFLPGTYTTSAWPGPGLGNWDNNSAGFFPLPVPQPEQFNPSLCDGQSVVSCDFSFSQNPGAYPYMENWDAGIEREMPWNMLVTATYVGNRGVHLASLLHPQNQLNPGILSSLCPGGVTPNYGGQCVLGDVWTDSKAQSVLAQHGYGIDANGLHSPYETFYSNYGGANSGATVMQALVPFPQSPGILWNDFENEGASSYNALQVQVQKRASSGLSLLANYTLARNMGNAEVGRSYNIYPPALNSQNPKAEYTVTSFDETHVINIAYVYDLPFGPGSRFLNRGGSLMKNLIGGWQTSGILNYSSGTPLSVSAGGNPLNNGFNRANIVPGVKPMLGSWKDVDKCRSYAGGQCVPYQLLNPAAFSDPGSWVPGNSPRELSDLRLPWYENENMKLGKKFFIANRVQAELSIEYFNVFNRVVKQCAPDTDISDGGSFGLAPTFCQSDSPRQGQAFFRITF